MLTSPNVGNRKDVQGTSWITASVVLALFLSSLNVFYFISQAASPLIISDAWHFLEMSISKWSLGGYDLSDLFEKRGVTDHAQPAYRIALLINYKFFNLDFRYEGIIGFICVFIYLSIFTLIYLNEIKARGCQNLLSAVAFIGAILTLTSLNATDLYTWPLVTFGFLTQLSFIIVSLLTWKYLNEQSNILSLVLSALLMLLIGDTASVILWLSLVISIAIFYSKNTNNNKLRSIIWCIGSTAFVITLFALINVHLIDSTFLKSEATNPVSWRDPYTYIDAARIVFSSSLIHAQHFAIFESYAVVASSTVAFIIFGFYIKYFILLFRTKVALTSVKFITTSILIYATVSVVAIAYGRIPTFDIDYLNQPRYVLAYQLIPFALLVDYAFALSDKRSTFYGVGKFVTIILFILLFTVQTYMSIMAYSSIEWISRYQDKQAKSIGAYLIDTDIPSGNCDSINFGICSLPVVKRNELLNLLKAEQLNIMNSAFQWKYRYFPLEDISEEFKTLNVLNWGPRKISRTNDALGIFIKLNRGFIDARSKATITIGSYKASPIMDKDIMTFSVPREISNSSGVYPIELRESEFPNVIQIGLFEVK